MLTLITKYVSSAGRIAAERTVFPVDRRIITNELGSTANAKPSRHHNRLQNPLQKSAPCFR